MSAKKPRQPIHHFRKARGLTIDALAKEMEVNKRTVIRWEHGEPPIPTERLDKAMRILDAKRHELRPDLAALFAEPAGATQ
jgi:transcriptional regulator with XRE-family HTH domain